MGQYNQKKIQCSRDLEIRKRYELFSVTKNIQIYEKYLTAADSRIPKILKRYLLL